jgi:hypothetical protein
MYSKFALLISFLCLNANSSVKIFSTKYFKYLILNEKSKPDLEEIESLGENSQVIATI